MYIILFLVGVAARNLNNISYGDFRVMWVDTPDFAYECTGLNLFGYSDLCNEWIEVLQQKRVLNYLTPAGIDLALHYTVKYCIYQLSHFKCIELIDGLLLNGANPCSIKNLITPYDVYIQRTLFPKFDILNRLMCD